MTHPSMRLTPRALVLVTLGYTLILFFCNRFFSEGRVSVIRDFAVCFIGGLLAGIGLWMGHKVAGRKVHFAMRLAFAVVVQSCFIAAVVVAEIEILGERISAPLTSLVTLPFLMALFDQRGRPSIK